MFIMPCKHMQPCGRNNYTGIQIEGCNVLTSDDVPVAHQLVLMTDYLYERLTRDPMSTGLKIKNKKHSRPE